MGYRLLSVLVFIFAIASLPSVLLFVFTIGGGGILGFFDELFKGRLLTIFYKDAWVLLFLVGCWWWGLFALIYGCIHFHKLGTKRHPKKFVFGLLIGVVATFSYLIGVMHDWRDWQEINKLFVLQNYNLMLAEVLRIMVPVFLMGGGQAILGSLLLLKIWLVKSGRMQAPSFD